MKHNNKIFKPLLSFMIFFLLFNLGFSEEHIISSCPSSWISGDTYIFTNLVSNLSCELGSNGDSNLIIQGNFSKEDYGIDFIITGNLNNITFQNFNIKFFRIKDNDINTGGHHLKNINILNNTFYNQDRNIIDSVAILDKTYFANFNITNNLIIGNNNIGLIGKKYKGHNYNCFLYLTNFSIKNNEFLNFGFIYKGNTTYDDSKFSYILLDNYHIFENNIIVSKEFFSDYVRSNDITSNCEIEIKTNNLISSFIIGQDSDKDYLDDTTYTLFFSDCVVYNSKPILKKKSVIFNNIYYYGNIEPFNDYFIDNYRIIFVKNFTLNTTKYINLLNSNNVTLDFSLFFPNTALTFTAPYQLKLFENNNIDCSFFSNSPCIFDENSDAIISQENRGYITVNGNNKINNIYFEKDSLNSNAQLISNEDWFPKSNLIISNCIFNKQDQRNKNGDEHLIALKFNNLKMFNNKFLTGGLSNNTYELLKIVSTDKNLVKIYNNIFNSTLPNKNSQEIFSESSEISFYNNYIDLAYNITNNIYNTIYVNPLISYYNNLDNKIYYFHIGNYYNGFSNIQEECNDSNNNGICDNSYISGIILDEYPLSEYPFNFKNHLLTANYSIYLADFNITIYVPESNNLVYDLTSTNDYLEFAFAHNSDLLDLQCSYIINGNSVYSITNTNNSIHNIYLNNFNEGYYSFYVECWNNYIYKKSEIYSFFVNFPGGSDPPENYTNNNNNNNGNNNNIQTINNNFQEFNNTIISDDIEQTNQNVIGIMGSLSDMFLNTGLRMGIFIFTMFLIGAVVRIITI